MSWRERALCREVDPDLFYPEKGAYLQSQQAVRVCRKCEVQSECLLDGLNEEFGIWGGTTAHQRRYLRIRMAS